MRSITRFIGFRYLKPRKGEAFSFVVALFSFVGMLLGVATLIIVMSVMNGFREELFSKIFGVNGHMGIRNIVQQESYDGLIDKIQAVDGIELATPFLYGQVLATGPKEASGAIVKALPKKYFQERPILKDSVVTGDLNAFEGKHNAIIGFYLAEKLGLQVGDKIKVISTTTTPSPFGAVPRQKDYNIVGLSRVGMYDFDRNTIYLPLEAAQLFFKKPNKLSEIDLLVTDPFSTDDLFSTLYDLLQEEGHKYAIISDWKQRNSHFYDALQTESSVMFVILTLIIIVAAFNIISSMIMLVKSKFKDIAILKTMGASRAMVMKIFLLTGSSIGFFGTLFGTGLGLLITYNIQPIFESLRTFMRWAFNTELFDQQIYYLSTLPANVDLTEVSLIVVMSFTLTLLSALYPAWRAAQLHPVKALKNE